MYATKMLDCIFIDECHTLITFELFQKVLYPLYFLRRFNVPLIFMTGTLPPKFEHILRKKYQLDPWIVKRSPNKPNIGYRIQFVDRMAFNDTNCIVKDLDVLLRKEQGKKGETLNR